MNRSPLRIRHSHIKPIALAVALALPGAAALAQPLSDVVTTRPDQTVTQQYGRESVYAFSPDAKPLTPAQTGSHAGFLTEVKQYSANAWDKTKEYSENAWDKTKALLAPKPGAVNPNEPQRYGRAGGYVGADEIAFLNSDRAPTTAVQTADAVKDGSAQIDRDAAVNREATVNNDTTSGHAPDATTVPDTTTQATPSTAPEEHNGRTAGNRFDNPEGTRGQDENGG
jgi:hypothetical protein